MPYGVYEAGVAGDEVSSTYEGRHLTFSESQLIHPDNTAEEVADYVNKGDPVLVGENIVGVALKDGAAVTDLIAIDTEGIWQLSVLAEDEGGASAVVVGDELYIHKTTAIISKTRNPTTHARFGYALYPIAAGTDVIPVKVHWDPDVELNDIVWAKGITFAETVGAGVWTGSVNVPAGAFLVDIIVHAVALWDSETSAAMIVGDVADPNGFFDAINLKATDLLVGESISFSHAGGKHGADLDVADGHVRRRYLVGARVISGEITKVGDTGSAGRTRMTVYYSLPTTVVTATKV